MHTKARVQINSKSGNFVMTGCVPITFWCRLADQWAALDVNHPHLSTFPQPERENLFFFSFSSRRHWRDTETSYASLHVL